MVDPALVFTLDNPQGQYPVYFPSASHTRAGMMSAADKVKLDLLTPGAGAYNTIQDEGAALPQQTILNFIGAGVTAANDGANNRTNVTISATAFGVSYTIQGGDGNDFFVPLGQTMANNGYKVATGQAGSAASPFVEIQCPTAAGGDRTTTQFRVLTSAPLTVGEVLNFIVSA